MQERLNEEICRRECVISIFPNAGSALRMAAARLAETNDKRHERVYVDMNEYNEWEAVALNLLGSKQRPLSAAVPAKDTWGEGRADAVT